MIENIFQLARALSWQEPRAPANADDAANMVQNALDNQSFEPHVAFLHQRGTAAKLGSRSAVLVAGYDCTAESAGDVLEYPFQMHQFWSAVASLVERASSEGCDPITLDDFGMVVCTCGTQMQAVISVRLAGVPVTVDMQTRKYMWLYLGGVVDAEELEGLECPNCGVIVLGESLNALRIDGELDEQT
jgi:hypothetical protein